MLRVESGHSQGDSPSAWGDLRSPKEPCRRQSQNSANEREALCDVIQVVSIKDSSETQRFSIETGRGQKSTFSVQVSASDSQGWLFGRGSVTFADLNEKKVRICDPTVSSKHFRLFRDATQDRSLVICDLGSLHGTKVNGTLITVQQPHIVKAGDLIVIGAAKVRLLENENNNTGNEVGLAISSKSQGEDDYALMQEQALTCSVCLRNISDLSPDSRASHILECSSNKEKDGESANESSAKNSKREYKACSICAKDLTYLNGSDQYAHVHMCMNEIVNNTGTKDTDDDKLRNSQSLAETVDLRSPSSKELPLSESSSVSCPLCGKDLSKLTKTQQQGHANRCADKLNPKLKKAASDKAKGAKKLLGKKTDGKADEEDIPSAKGEASIKAFLDAEPRVKRPSSVKMKAGAAKSQAQEERFVFNKCISSVIADEDRDFDSDDDVFVEEPVLLSKKRELETEARELHFLHADIQETVHSNVKETSERQKVARIAHFTTRSSESNKFPSPFRPSVPVSRDLLLRRKAFLQSQLGFVDELLEMLSKADGELNSTKATSSEATEEENVAHDAKSNSRSQASSLWSVDQQVELKEVNIAALIKCDGGNPSATNTVRIEGECETRSSETTKLVRLMESRDEQ